jgi:hypothetical protein
MWLLSQIQNSWIQRFILFLFVLYLKKIIIDPLQSVNQYVSKLHRVCPFHILL